MGAEAPAQVAGRGCLGFHFEMRQVRRGCANGIVGGRSLARIPRELRSAACHYASC